MLTAMVWKEPEEHVAKRSELGVAGAGDSSSYALAKLKEVAGLHLENTLLIDNVISIRAVS